MKLEDMPGIQEVELLQPKEGEILVLTANCVISMETAVRLKKDVEENFPGVKCMVLADGLKLSVIPADATIHIQSN